MQHVTFGGWHDGTSWTLRGNAVPMADDLSILTGDPEKYRAYAADYFGATLPIDAVAHVLAGKKLNAKLVKRISTERTLAELKAGLRTRARSRRRSSAEQEHTVAGRSRLCACAL